MKKLTGKQIKTINMKISVGTDSYIVLVDTMGDRTVVGDECNKNIYCVNSNYDVVWQVKVDETGFEADPFVYIWLDNKKLLANKFHGNEYEIDISTGMATEIGWHK